MEKIEIKIKLLHPDAKTPIYGSPESAGFDFYATKDVIISPGSSEVFSTGVSLELPKGFCLQLWGRSGLAKKGIFPVGGLGDSDYRGEYKVILRNQGTEPAIIKKGDRIVQGVPIPIPRVEFIETVTLSETLRGGGGFGSTGEN